METKLRRPSPPVYFETGGLTLSQASRGSTLWLGKAGQPRGDRNCKVLSPRAPRPPQPTCHIPSYVSAWLVPTGLQQAFLPRSAHHLLRKQFYWHPAMAMGPCLLWLLCTL